MTVGDVLDQGLWAAVLACPVVWPVGFGLAVLALLIFSAFEMLLERRQDRIQKRKQDEYRDKMEQAFPPLPPTGPLASIHRIK